MSLAYRSFIASAPQATPSLFRPLAPSLLRYRLCSGLQVSELRILCILHSPTVCPSRRLLDSTLLPVCLGNYQRSQAPSCGQLRYPHPTVDRLSLVACRLSLRSCAPRSASLLVGRSTRRYSAGPTDARTSPTLSQGLQVSPLTVASVQSFALLFLSRC